MPKTLEITDEAQECLIANLREGYSRKRLASEAIIEKYGKPLHSMGPTNEPSLIKGNPVEHAAKIVRAVGSPATALRHLEQYIEVDGEHRRNVRNVLIDMLESEAIGKGGKK